MGIVVLLLALSACAGAEARPVLAPAVDERAAREPVYELLDSLDVPALRDAPFVRVTTTGDSLPLVTPAEAGSNVLAREGLAFTAAGFLIGEDGDLFTVQHGPMTIEYDRSRGASYVEQSFDDEIAVLLARGRPVYRGEGPRIALALLAYRLDARGETELAARALRSSTLDAAEVYDEMSALEARDVLLRMTAPISNGEARKALAHFLARFGRGRHAPFVRQTLEGLDLVIADEASWPLRAANASIDERAIHDLASAPQIDALVARGCAALPTMLAHLDDARITRVPYFVDDAIDGLSVPRTVGVVVRAAMLHITRGEGETAELASDHCAREAAIAQNAPVDPYPAMLERIRSGDVDEGTIVELLYRQRADALRTALRSVARDHREPAIRAAALAALADHALAPPAQLARTFERELRALVASVADDQMSFEVLELLVRGLLETTSEPRDRVIERVFTQLGPKARELSIERLLWRATAEDYRPPTEVEAHWVDEIASRAFSDPRASTPPDCSAPIDYVAMVLALHLKRHFSCELAAPVRAAQRTRIYNAWRAQRGQEPLVVPEIPNVPPIAPAALEAARSRLLAARTRDEVERAAEAFLGLGLGAQLEFFDTYASMHGSIDDHHMHLWLPFAMLVYAATVEGDPALEPLFRAQVGQVLTATKVQELLLELKRAVPTGMATIELTFEPGLGVTLRAHVEDALASEPSVICESDRGYCSGPSRHSGRRFEDRIVANYDRIARAIRFHAMDGDVATFRVVAQW